MTYPCELLDKPTQPTLAIRTRTAVSDLPTVIGGAFSAIAQYLGEIGEQPAGPPFAGYYNMDMQDLDVEIGFPVTKSLPGKGEIQASEFPGGKFAACLFTGPYGDIEAAYKTLTAWIEEQGHNATGVAYELYLNDPAEIPPDRLQTQILFPVEGA